MFWSKSKKKRKKVYPCKPQFYSIKAVCKGVLVFVMSSSFMLTGPCNSNYPLPLHSKTRVNSVLYGRVDIHVVIMGYDFDID